MARLIKHIVQPLAAAFDDLGKLKIYLYSDNTDPTVDAIWKIYESQVVTRWRKYGFIIVNLL